jgi:hypothetical protein
VLIDNQGGLVRPGKAIAFVLLSVASIPALACAAPLPEPGLLELLAISAVAGVAIAIRNRRK